MEKQKQFYLFMRFQFFNLFRVNIFEDDIHENCFLFIVQHPESNLTQDHPIFTKFREKYAFVKQKAMLSVKSFNKKMVCKTASRALGKK